MVASGSKNQENRVTALIYSHRVPITRLIDFRVLLIAALNNRGGIAVANLRDAGVVISAENSALIDAGEVVVTCLVYKRFLKSTGLRNRGLIIITALNNSARSEEHTSELQSLMRHS